MRAALEEAGLDKKSYAGHSFRIGAATTASLCGISEATINLNARSTGKRCLPALHSHSTGVSCKGFSIDQFQFKKDELTGTLYLELFWVYVLGFEFIIGDSL